MLLWASVSFPRKRGSFIPSSFARLFLRGSRSQALSAAQGREGLVPPEVCGQEVDPDMAANRHGHCWHNKCYGGNAAEEWAGGYKEGFTGSLGQ